MLGSLINAANRHTARWLAERLRQLDPRRVIVFGGPEVLSLVEEARRPGVC